MRRNSLHYSCTTSLLLVLSFLSAAVLAGRASEAVSFTQEPTPWLRISSLTLDQKKKISAILERVDAQRSLVSQTLSSRSISVGPSGVGTAYDRYQALQGVQITDITANGEIWGLLSEAQRMEAGILWKSHQQSLTLNFLYDHLKPQESSSFCWAACLQSVLEAAGIEISQNTLANRLTSDSSGGGLVLTNLVKSAFAVPEFRDFIANRAVYCFLYPIDLGDVAVIRVFTEPRFIVLPLSGQHAVLVTGITWAGFGGDTEIKSITYFDPEDSSTNQISEVQWHDIRKSLPGILNVSVGPITFSVTPHKVGDMGYLFSDEIFLVSRNGKMLFVNKNGNNVLGQDFDDVRRFQFGYIAKSGGKWSYLEGSGISHPLGEFSDMRGFGFGGQHYMNLAAAQKGGKWGFIDLNGNLVIQPRWDDVGEFSANRCPVKGQSSWGYIDDSGAVVIGAHFDRVTPFVYSLQATQSVAFAQIGKDWRIIDQSGSPAIESTFEDVASISFKNFGAKKNGKWGYATFDGAWIIPPRFEEAGMFVCGLAPVKEAQKSFGFIDEFGSYVILPKFKQAMPMFSNNGAIVEVDQGWGIIDRTGTFVLRPSYAALAPIDGQRFFATDCTGEAWYIDGNGRRLVDFGRSPILDTLRGRKIVNVKFSGNFQGCTAYFIPLADWEDGSQRLIKDRATVFASQGIPTNGIVQAFDNTYIVLTEKSSNLQTNRIQPLTGTSNVVINVTFR